MATKILTNLQLSILGLREECSIGWFEIRATVLCAFWFLVMSGILVTVGSTWSSIGTAGIFLVAPCASTSISKVVPSRQNSRITPQRTLYKNRKRKM